MATCLEFGRVLFRSQERHAEGGADLHGDQKIHSANTCHLDSLHRWKGRARLTGTRHGNPDSLRRCKPDQVRGSALTRTLSTIGCSPVSWMTTTSLAVAGQDRKSTRLNSSHVAISYAVFCL